MCSHISKKEEFVTQLGWLVLHVLFEADSVPGQLSLSEREHN